MKLMYLLTLCVVTDQFIVASDHEKVDIISKKDSNLDDVSMPLDRKLSIFQKEAEELLKQVVDSAQAKRKREVEESLSLVVDSDEVNKEKMRPSPLSLSCLDSFHSLCDQANLFKRLYPERMSEPGFLDKDGEPLIDRSFRDDKPESYYDEAVRGVLVVISSFSNEFSKGRIPSPLSCCENSRPLQDRRLPSCYTALLSGHSKLPIEQRLDLTKLQGLVTITYPEDSSSSSSSGDEK